MVGNTGYLGLSCHVGFCTQYFSWRRLYDMLGTTLELTARCSPSRLFWHWCPQTIGSWGPGDTNQSNAVELWVWLGSTDTTSGWTKSGGIGLDYCSADVNWDARLSQLNSWHSLPRASISFRIKMLVPHFKAFIAVRFNRFAPIGVVLQMAMPPAFATLAIAGSLANLDRENCYRL